MTRMHMTTYRPFRGLLRLVQLRTGSLPTGPIRRQSIPDEPELPW